MPHVSRIIIYPVKSLEGVAVDHAIITPSGALEGDRAIAFFDTRGKFINGKRQPAIHLLRSSFDRSTKKIHLRTADGSRAGSFDLGRDRSHLEAWLTEYFGQPITVKEDHIAGFPDDTDAPGPTVIAAATLEEVTTWFTPVTTQSVRQRFRANIEIAGVPPFWEDRLYKTAGTVQQFQVGSVIFQGTNPCQRCAVPPRDPHTGEGYPGFSTTFTERREQLLPDWAERSRFNHFYRLAVNTQLSPNEAGKTIHLGDQVSILDS